MRSAYNMAMSNIMSHFQLDFTLMQISILYPELLLQRARCFSRSSQVCICCSQLFTHRGSDNSAGNALRQTDLVQILYALEGETSSLYLSRMWQQEPMAPIQQHYLRLGQVSQCMCG